MEQIDQGEAYNRRNSPQPKSNGGTPATKKLKSVPATPAAGTPSADPISMERWNQFKDLCGLHSLKVAGASKKMPPLVAGSRVGWCSHDRSATGGSVGADISSSSWHIYEVIGEASTAEKRSTGCTHHLKRIDVDVKDCRGPASSKTGSTGSDDLIATLSVLNYYKGKGKDAVGKESWVLLIA